MLSLPSMHWPNSRFHKNPNPISMLSVSGHFRVRLLDNGLHRDFIRIHEGTSLADVTARLYACMARNSAIQLDISLKALATRRECLKNFHQKKEK